MRNELTEWIRFLQAEGAVLTARPHLLFQQAANQPDSTAPARAARKRFAAGLEKRPWLRWINKPDLPAGCRMILAAHSDPVTCCCYSPDGQWLLSGSADETLRLWEARSGILAASFPHTITWQCGFSPDSDRLVVARGYDIELLDAHSGARRLLLEGHTGPVTAWAWTPDGQRLLTASRDGTLRLWVLAEGRCAAVLSGHSDTVLHCVVSPDGKLAASASADGTLRLWQVETGQERARFNHPGPVQRCAFSLDGATALAGTAETAVVWDVATGQALRSIVVDGPVADFSPDRTRLLSVSGARTMAIHDLDSGRCLARLRGHADEITHCVFSPDGASVLSASYDCTLRAWDAAPPPAESEARGETLSHAFTKGSFAPDGRTLLFATADGKLVLAAGDTASPLRTLPGHSKGVSYCEYSAAGTRIVSASDDYSGNTVTVWNPDGGEVGTLAGLEGQITAVAISSDGRRVACACEGGSVKLWDTEGATLDLDAQSNLIERIRFSADGQRMVTASSDGQLMLWRAESGKRLTVLSPRGGTGAFHFSPDGKRLAAVYGTDVLRICDTERGAGLHRLTGHTDAVTACAFLPSGAQVLSASLDGTIRLWDAATGASLASYPHRLERVERLVCSACGTRAIASSAALAVLFDIASGQLIATAPAMREFSPDGSRLLATGTENLSLSVLDTATGSELCSCQPAGSIWAARWSPDGTRVLLTVGTGSRKAALHLLGYEPGDGIPPAHSPRPRLRDESAAMEAFAEAHLEQLAIDEHETALKALIEFAESGTQPLCVLTGAPGSGKSAVLARLIAVLRSQHPDYCTISHFSGATAIPGDRRLLGRLCRELDEGEFPEDLDGLRARFLELLETAALERRIVLVLDGVDEMELRWLPEELPGKVRIVLSAGEGEVLEILRARRCPPREIRLPAPQNDCLDLIPDGADASLARAFSLIAASRRGLAIGEMAALLGRSAAFAGPWMARRGDLLDFSLGQFRHGAKRKFLSTPEERAAAHRTLAASFRKQADPAGDRSWTGPARSLCELLYHEVEGALWTEVREDLTDLAYLEARCAAVRGGVYDLQDDYRHALALLS